MNGPFLAWERSIRPEYNIKRVKMKKEIQIRRKEKMSYLPAAVVAEAKRKIGSIYDGMAPLTGLTEKQERKYLPKVLGISITSQDYEKRVRNFWANMTINVPADGIVLNIGLSDNKEPEKILDWIKYQWLLKHRFVATSKDKMVGDVEFYIHDPEIETQKTNVNVQDKKAAYKEFIKLSNKPDVVNRLIRVLGKRNPLGMSEIMKENFLATIVENQPKEFYRVSTNKDLELQDTIMHLVEVGILRKIGTAFLYLDTEIGATLEESIHFFKSKRNSQAIAEMKAKLKELVPQVAKIGGNAPSKPNKTTEATQVPENVEEAQDGEGIETDQTESDTTGADFLNEMVDEEAS